MAEPYDVIGATNKETAPRLLLVDDQQENLLLLRDILQADGYLLDLAESGSDALGLLAGNRYACILCDVQMPDMSGFQLLKLLRADPRHADAAFMFITAYGGNRQKVLEALELGALDFVCKPVEPRELRAKVRVLVALQRRKWQLVQQRDLFHATIGSLNEGVLVTDGETGATFVNSAMERLMGGQLGLGDALLRMQVLPLYSPTTHELIEDARNPFFLAARGVPVSEHEVFVLGGEGGGRYWMVSVLPLSGDSDFVPLVVVVVRDVTEERNALREIEQKNRDLEQYAYAASHDLRAPLRHIRSFGNILQAELGDSGSPPVREALAYMVKAAEDMRQLVDGLLELSIVGARALEVGRLALAPLVREIWGDPALVSVPAGAVLEVDESVGTVWADRASLRRVLVNLFQNAIKFRRPNTPLRVKVEVAALPTADRILVTDNGIGVPIEHADRVFQVFQRLHPKGEYEGCGIGLALCKKILELHGGAIWLGAPRDGEGGAVLTLELPRGGTKANGRPTSAGKVPLN